ncbi:MAG TPA: glycosyltransferase, partial [Solirubrobacteraceae bacterium]
MQTICLSMIVKDEAQVIRRCLDSVMPLIDSWAIVDTGSTDGTQAIVAEHLRDLPGVLVERPWVDFAHNRNEALDLASGRADYVFVIDADEVVEYAEGFEVPMLDADSYQVETRFGGCSYLRKQLIRASLPWRYRGVVHEHLECAEAETEAFLSGMRTVPHKDGARARDPETYRRDAEVLERALSEDPFDARNVFYLAQSYRDAGDLEAAAAAYRRRAEMGGWREEAWYALYQAAQVEETLGRPWGVVMETYLAAHEHTPDRAGPLFRVGLHYQQLGQRQLAHLFLRRAVEIPEPGVERLFVERQIYEYVRAYEYAIACYHVGDHATAIATANELLRSPFLPPDLITGVAHNRRLSLDAVRVRGPVREAPRVTVVVPPTTTGPERDDCIASLDAQRCEDFRVVSSAEEVGDDEVVLVLDPRDRLAGPDVLELIRLSFIDGGCQLVYGGHRDATGRLGDAAPAPDEETFRARGPALAGDSVLAHRAGVDWQQAGFAGTRFLDEVITVRTPAPPTPAPTRATGPLISCLMVTRDRLRLAKAAIASFALQTHPNRELVIVTDGSERYRGALARYVDAIGIDGVRFVVPDEQDLPLGALRNLAVAAARGEIVCQWDDDDYSHPER